MPSNLSLKCRNLLEIVRLPMCLGVLRTCDVPVGSCLAKDAGPTSHPANIKGSLRHAYFCCQALTAPCHARVTVSIAHGKIGDIPHRLASPSNCDGSHALGSLSFSARLWSLVL